MAAITAQGRDNTGGTRHAQRPGARGFVSRVLSTQLNPSQLAPIPVCVLFVLARQFGAIADEPLWLLLGVVGIGWFASSVAAKVFPRRTTLQLAVEIGSIALVTYTIGWGALLAIGFLFNVAGHLDDVGSRVGRPAMIFSVIGIGLGELAIVLGIARSMFPEPAGHGLAVLEAVGVCFVIWMLTYTTRQKETVESDLRRSEEQLRAMVADASRAQEQLKFQAYHDALTSLPNRWQFLENVEEALFDASTHGRYVAVMFLDVDRFKLVNDTLGHDIGDRLLVQVAERLQQCLRPNDVVARLGGDEFSVLLPYLPGPDVAIHVADRIVACLREPVVAGEHELYVSASVGIAISQEGQVLASDLLRQSDVAMYTAKENGRARWEIFDPQQAPHMMERLELEGDLWRAIDNGELVVNFQPEMELTSGRVVATEALIRWEHPKRGVIMPDRFVPFAEESGLIVAIDKFVLREACGWARVWSKLERPTAMIGNEVEPLVVSVNLSPRFMRQDDVVAEIVRVFEETGVDPRCVQIELTERSALTDLEFTSMKLRQLRALGVRVAIDDFGTGYSSLSYLKRLPIDVLKLDKTLLDAVDTVEADVAIVQAAITMGHALGMTITAEGVERVEQANQLRALGCDSAVGWLWSPAVSPEQLGAYAMCGFSMTEALPSNEPALSAVTGG